MVGEALKWLIVFLLACSAVQNGREAGGDSPEPRPDLALVHAFLNILLLIAVIVWL